MLWPVKWHRTASSVSSAWCDLGRAARCPIQLHSSHSFSSKPLALEEVKSVTKVREKKKRPAFRTFSPDEERNVDPNSLRNTLEAHREANRASLIFKIAGPGTGRQNINIPPLLDEKGQIWRQSAPGPLSNLHRRVKIEPYVAGRGSWEKEPPQDYEGKSREPYREWAYVNGISYLDKYPWMGSLQNEEAPGGNPTATERLGREMDAFNLYSRPTPSEVKAANAALTGISAALKTWNETLQIDIVGSRATGLATPLSDLDLNISTTATQKIETESIAETKPRKLLSSLFKYLRKQKATSHRQVRAQEYRKYALVPIIAGSHVPTNLKFQVQTDMGSFVSMQQIISFTDEFPILRSLFVALKQMLTMRGLVNGPHGGLTSYPLFIMIVAALKFSEGKIERRDTGRQLLFFLDMYSDIDFYTTGISFSPLQYVTKRHPRSSTMPTVQSAPLAPDQDPSTGTLPQVVGEDLNARRWFATVKSSRPYLMCLQDPADLYNDLGKSAYWIKDVQATFIDVRSKLNAALQEWDETGEKAGKGPMLACCLGGDYRIFNHERQALQEAGRASDQAENDSVNE